MREEGWRREAGREEEREVVDRTKKQEERKGMKSGREITVRESR